MATKRKQKLIKLPIGFLVLTNIVGKSPAEVALKANEFCDFLEGLAEIDVESAISFAPLERTGPEGRNKKGR